MPLKTGLLFGRAVSISLMMKVLIWSFHILAGQVGGAFILLRLLSNDPSLCLMPVGLLVFPSHTPRSVTTVPAPFLLACCPSSFGSVCTLSFRWDSEKVLGVVYKILVFLCALVRGLLEALGPFLSVALTPFAVFFHLPHQKPVFAGIPPLHKALLC